MTGADNAAQYYSRFGEAAYSAADQMAAAEYLRAHTTAAGRLATVGYESTVMFLSGRMNATRFSYALPLVGWRSTPATRNGYQREFMAALAPPPLYIVVGQLLIGKPLTGDVFPDLTDLLARDYVLEQTCGAVQLYRRVR